MLDSKALFAFGTVMTGVLVMSSSSIMRRIALTCLSLSAVLAGSATAPAAAQSRAPRPNVVLILADDMGYETIGANGGSSYQTPLIDKMAAEGLRFTNAYAHPLCTPSRVALMTGRYNFRNYTSFGVLKRDEKTIGNMFRDAGYKTLIAGKWQLSEADYEAPHHFGFDEYMLWNFGQADRGSRYWDPRFFRMARLVPDTTDKFGPDIMADVVADFINQHRAEPFFVYSRLYSTRSMGGPAGYKPAAGESETEKRQRRFGAMVAYVDKMVGRVNAQLEASNLAKNTLVIFTGDNGTFPSLHSVLNGKVVKGDKGAPTDAGTHVPLIARWPGRVPAGRVTDDLVDFTDFVPTLAAITGVSRRTESRSMGAALRRSWPGVRESRVNGFTATTARRWANFKPSTHAQDKRYKLYADGRFYDYRADPLEASPLTQPLKSDQAAAKKKLQRVIDAFAAQGAAPGRAADIPARP